jgi:hypothetical protein
VYNGTWSTYNNYVYDPYGDYTFVEFPHHYYNFTPNGGNYSWNSSNVGYYNDTSGSEIFYYKLVDNSFFCGHWGAKWFWHCDPYHDYRSTYDPFGSHTHWGISNYYYDPYGGNYTYDSFSNYYRDD